MKKKILLVDDKATIGKVASIYLGKDYDVMYLENPIKAIDWLNEGNVPDLIISVVLSSLDSITIGIDLNNSLAFIYLRNSSPQYFA